MAGDKEEIVAETPGEVAKGYTKVHLSTWHLMRNNFVGGIAWGFGVVLGGTVIVAILLFLLNILNGVPIIGEFISNVINSVSFYQNVP